MELRLPRRKAAPLESELTADQIKRLRQLRVEFQDLQSLLESISKGETSLDKCVDYIEKTRKDIDEIFGEFKDHKGDTIRHMFNLWEQLIHSPIIKDPKTPIPADQQLLNIKMLNNRINEIIFYLCQLTIPERLNEWLEQSWPGYYVPFHLVFEDELPSTEDRIKLLKYLAYSPRALNAGIVNLGSGLIYRYSKSMMWRIFSLFVLILSFVALTVGIYHSGDLYVPGNNLTIGPWQIPLYMEGWPITPSDQSPLLIAWFAILIGIMVHAAVEAAKVEQKEGIPPLISIRNILKYIDAKLGWLLWKLGLALIGLFGFVFAYGPTTTPILGNVTPYANVTLLNNLTVINNVIMQNNVTGLDNAAPFTAFLLGYSLDSFVGLFGSSLEQRSAAQVVALKKQLGMTDKELPLK